MVVTLNIVYEQQVVHVVQQNIMFGQDPVNLTCRNCGANVSELAKPLILIILG